MYKYIVFDVDGTMIDTEEAVMYAYQSVIFKKHGRYFTEEELLKGYGVPTPKSLEAYGFTDIEQAVKDYYEYLVKGFEKSRAFEGINELIVTLKNMNIPLGVVTSRSEYEVEMDPCLNSLADKFKAIVTSDHTVLHKPNGEPLQKAMEQLNASPSETLYIGDTVFDRLCAKNAGVKFALALWGTNNAANIDADYFLKKPEDLLDIL